MFWPWVSACRGLVAQHRGDVQSRPRVSLGGSGGAVLRRCAVLCILETFFFACRKQGCGWRRGLALLCCAQVFLGTATWNGGVRGASQGEAGRDRGMNVPALSGEQSWTCPLQRNKDSVGGGRANVDMVTKPTVTGMWVVQHVLLCLVTAWYRMLLFCQPRLQTHRSIAGSHEVLQSG